MIKISWNVRLSVQQGIFGITECHSPTRWKPPLLPREPQLSAYPQPAKDLTSQVAAQSTQAPRWQRQMRNPHRFPCWSYPCRLLRSAFSFSPPPHRRTAVPLQSPGRLPQRTTSALPPSLQSILGLASLGPRPLPGCLSLVCLPS